MRIRTFWCYFTFLILPLSVHAQDELATTIDINLADVCEEQSVDKVLSPNNSCEKPEQGQAFESLTNFTKEVDKFQVCRSINEMVTQEIKPIEIDTKDGEGNPWKIRLHFGYTRTDYRPTNVKIESSLITANIKGFEFDERTSSKHYDPKTWKNFADAFTWIDEPSNTYEISVENKKNAFYLTAFHPKTLATYYAGKDTDGSTKYIKASEDGHLSTQPYEAFLLAPKGYQAFEIQNTHQLMNYSIGYGRKFNIMDSKKTGELTYIIRVNVGAMVGSARALHFTEEGVLSIEKEKLAIQGASGGLGHRVEYKNGKVGLYIEQKYTKNKIEHGYFDGKASYDLNFSTINFGVNVDVSTKKKKPKTEQAN